MSHTDDRAVLPPTAGPLTTGRGAGNGPHLQDRSSLDLPASVLMGDPRLDSVGTLECGEPLVDVRRFSRIVVDARLTQGSGSSALVRVGVLDRLLRASDALPSGLRLVLVEGYRSVEHQRAYFDEQVARLRHEHPTLDEDARRRQTTAYVSAPELAPHCSGAAVDVTLADASGGPLDMGTQVGDSPLDCRDCFTHAPRLGDRVRRNRALLHAVMDQAGFVNYPTEWWHFSYGDHYWAFHTDRAAALYGTIASPWAA